MNIRIVLVVALSLIGTSQALECFGHTCTGGQYCLVEITQNTGTCYTHHGNGQHEAHQQCIGAHHPGSHCFCMDQTCVNSMSHATTAAPTTTHSTGSTAQPSMTSETTTVSSGTHTTMAHSSVSVRSTK